MCDIVKREKHQNRLVRPSGGVTWGAQECVLRERFCSKSSTLTECSMSLPGHGAGKCMTSDWSARAEACARMGSGAATKGAPLETCPSLDRIKREKGVWWMPWQQEAMKDVIPCDKLWGAGNRL